MIRQKPKEFQTVAGAINRVITNLFTKDFIMSGKSKSPEKDAVKKLRELYFKRREDTLTRAKELAEKVKQKKKDERAASPKSKRPRDLEA